jgi:hypothetical protein
MEVNVNRRNYQIRSKESGTMSTEWWSCLLVVFTVLLVLLLVTAYTNSKVLKAENHLGLQDKNFSVHTSDYKI